MMWRKTRLALVCGLMAVTAAGYAKTGDIDIKYTAVFALTQDGTPHVDHQPKDEAYCRSHFEKHYATEPFTIHYTIDPVSQLQDVRVDFLTEKALPLHPEGLTDRYYFLSDGVGSLQQHHVAKVFVFIDKALQLASTKVVFDTPNNYQCVMVGVGPVA